jgi:hypothetical protein
MAAEIIIQKIVIPLIENNSDEFVENFTQCFYNRLVAISEKEKTINVDSGKWLLVEKDIKGVLNGVVGIVKPYTTVEGREKLIDTYEQEILSEKIFAITDKIGDLFNDPNKSPIIFTNGGKFDRQYFIYCIKDTTLVLLNSYKLLNAAAVTFLNRRNSKSSSFS